MIKKALRKYNSLSVVLRATIWFIFCSTLQKSLAFVTTPLFTRMMTPEHYGQFNTFHSWSGILLVLTTLRLNYAVFNKGMSKYKDERDAYTSTMQTITFFLAAVALIIYIIFHNQFNKWSEMPTYIMLALFGQFLFAPAVDFWTIRKRYEYIYRPVVFRTLLMLLLYTAGGLVAVALTEEKGYARILSEVATNLAFGIPLFIYNRKKGKTWFNKKHASFALRFNLPLLLHHLSLYVLNSFDTIMVQKMVSFAAAGLYGLAYRAGDAIKVISNSINSALIPWEYEQLEKKEFKKIDNVVFLSFVAMAGVSIMFSACAPELLMLLADNRYQEAIDVIPPVAISVLFSYMYTSFANVELFYENNKFTMYISTAGAVLNVVLNYIGIKLFGFVAAAYTTLICFILFAFSHYVYMTHCVRKEFGVKRVFRAGRIVVLSAVVIAFGLLIVLLYDHVIIRYSILAVILVAMFLKRKVFLDIIIEVRDNKKQAEKTKKDQKAQLTDADAEVDPLEQKASVAEDASEQELS